MTLTNIKNKASDRGFTIVELLIVIIVIGILATLVLIAYNNVQGQARDTKRQANANGVANAAETYKTTSTTGTYPDMSTGSSFQTAINTATNYTNGTKAVSVDPTVTGSATVSPNYLGATPASGNPNNISVLFCLNNASSTYDQASGIKLGYWSESSGMVKYVVTGTGAGTTNIAKGVTATCS